MYRRFTIKLCLLVLTMSLIFLVGCNSDRTNFYEAEGTTVALDNSSTSAKDYSEESSLIPVYVCGAVYEAGVYYLPAGSIKSEALAAAGGLSEGAAKDYINLAEVVVAGEKIYFPYEAEVEIGYNIKESENGSSWDEGLVNINTATKEELMTLPGIGDSKAEAIIAYRDENGPFQNVEDITNISGIKNGVYNNIKEYIVVN